MGLKGKTKSNTLSSKNWLHYEERIYICDQNEVTIDMEMLFK